MLEDHPIERTLTVGTIASSLFSPGTAAADNLCSKTWISTQEMSEVLGFVFRLFASRIMGPIAEDGRETIDIVDKAGRRFSLSIMDNTCPTMACLTRTRVYNPDIWLSMLLRAL